MHLSSLANLLLFFLSKTENETNFSASAMYLKYIEFNLISKEDLFSIIEKKKKKRRFFSLLINNNND